MRIAIAGLGTVGAETTRRLQSDLALIQARSGSPYQLTALSSRDRAKDRGIDMTNLTWVDTPTDLINHADLIIELIGGSEGPARDLVTRALQSGIHVITANKALIATHGVALARLAEHSGAQLRFEAAVAGAIPIISALSQGLSANRFTRLAGILNGTCNFILTTMEATGREFSDVLKEAQDKGFAEANPSFDVDGIDTAHKLAILTSLAYGTEVAMDAVHSEGIRRITPIDIQQAKALGYRIKLLGIAEETPHGIGMRVHPCMVALDHPMAQVSAEFNAVAVEGSASGPMVFEGRGAGGAPTASAVLSDVIDLLRGNKRPPFTVSATALQPHRASPMEAHEGRYYLRLTVTDRPGVLAAVTTVFHDTRISVQSCIQHAAQPNKPVDLVIVTHEAKESAMQDAISRIAALDCTLEEPTLIRIETL